MNATAGALAPRFRTARGLLTPYALACGYIQRATDTGAYLSCGLCLDLWHEGACYHVRAHDHAKGARIFWESFDNLADARRRFDRARVELKLKRHP